MFEGTNAPSKQKSTEKYEHAPLSSAFSHQCFCFRSAKETLVVAHRHKAVEAAGGIKCHTNHDQQAGTAQLDAHTGQVAQNDRQYSHRSQEDGPMRVILFRVRVRKSLVGLPGRKPGIEPLLRRRLLAISTGLYWMAT